MRYSEEQQYWIWLSSVPGIGARRFDRLLETFETPGRVWNEFSRGIEAIAGPQAYAALVRARSTGYLNDLFASMEKHGILAVTREDVEYPALLRSIPDPPPTLFLRGRLPGAGSRTLSIVGSRNASAYGTRMARRIAREVSAAGAVIVSGLARGIDGAAHRGALDAEAATVAVLGGGIDVMYPPEHQPLAEHILALGGCILSEHPPGTRPYPQHFPARNRVISGLGEALLVVEGAERSGAMSTVTAAMEQGREVFALPGQADSPLSALPHKLLREGVRLVTCGADLFEDMGWVVEARDDFQEPSQPARRPATQAEQRVIALLTGGPMDTDTMVEELEIAPQALNSLLTIMELQGLIRKLPGRKVERIGNMEE